MVSKHCLIRWIFHIKYNWTLFFCCFGADDTRSALLDLCLKDVNLSKAVDPKDITEKLNGFTGSDITNVCRYVSVVVFMLFPVISTSFLFLFSTSDAAMMSMRRKITGRSPAEIKQIRREEVDLPLTEQDFQEAMLRTRKSVSASDIARFEKWMAEYGSC